MFSLGRVTEDSVTRLGLREKEVEKARALLQGCII
jgi:hypothetical protein